MTDAEETGMPRFWGKYRGTVTDNEDPLAIGRLQVAVPAIPAGLQNWALPCVPYAGMQVGLCLTPPLGASVWVEFEGGDCNYPIWTGCFWQPGERPVAAAAPAISVLQTQWGMIALSDLPGEGGFTLKVGEPAVAAPVTIAATGLGLTISTGEIGVSVSDNGVNVVAPPDRVSISGIPVVMPAALP